VRFVFRKRDYEGISLRTRPIGIYELGKSVNDLFSYSNVLLRRCNEQLPALLMTSGPLGKRIFTYANFEVNFIRADEPLLLDETVDLLPQIAMLSNWPPPLEVNERRRVNDI
jgi:hypothetical protein